MSELTSDQLAELVLALRRLERELAVVQDASAEGAAPVDLDQPIGRISRIDAIQQQRMARANRGAIQQRLAQVRAALGRLEREEYGACAACGEAIGYPRLRARPETPLCIACQSARERPG
ncbi:MAG: TraR/DksA family transcriptional regulator [Myxococcota bacterium]|nr:TraR/DksA family transcriptional regulator [Myxococcota bacterium]